MRRSAEIRIEKIKLLKLDPMREREREGRNRKLEARQGLRGQWQRPEWERRVLGSRE